MVHSSACMPPMEPPSTRRRLADAERVEQPRLRADVVADANQRKVRPVDFAGFGIDGTGPRGAVTGAQHVDADDEVVLQREDRAGSKDLRPPGADQGRARERVANQNGIVARRIQPAVDGVMQRGTDRGSGRTRAAGSRRARSRLRRWAPRSSIAAAKRRCGCNCRS